MAHSLKPWRVDKSTSDFVNDANSKSIAFCNSASRDRAENAANAALIVRAVNAHDDLLSALRTARDRLALMLRPDDPRNDDAFRLVDDTIKRVEGE